MAKGGEMILDTCALLWLASGNKKLSSSALKQIAESPAVYVSAISGFEIAVKVSRGRLTLPLPSQEWFEKIADHHGISVIPLGLDVCIAAAQLPRIHDDPCDRFIIATALLNSLTVLTADEQFEKYGVKVLC
jgi:PIN domain nuclease of toxin-antitoxin system